MKQSVNIRWAQVRIGLFFAFAMVLLGLGILLVGKKNQFFTPSARVEVQLTNVQGLKVGAPVWLSGVTIGTVGEIGFADPIRSDRVTVILQLDLDAAKRIGSDAKVAIRSRGFLGEKYVDIIAGSKYGLPEAPLPGEPPMSLDQTMVKAYEAFDKLGTLTEQVGDPRGSLGRLFRDAALYDSLLDLTERLRNLVAAATEGEGSLARLINDPRLYSRLLAFSEKGEKTAGDVDRLVASLQDPKGSLFYLVHDPALYEESLKSLKRLRATLDETDALLLDLRQGEGTAARLIRDDALHQRLEAALREMEDLLRDLRENPGRYLHFSVF